MPPGTDTDSSLNLFDVAGSGSVILFIMVSLLFFVIRMMKKSAVKKVQAYRPMAEPLYVAVPGKSRISPGWYPTAMGDQDRYHDGKDWTETHRTHTAQGRMNDPLDGAGPVPGQAAPTAAEDRLFPGQPPLEEPVTVEVLGLKSHGPEEKSS